MGRRSGYSMYRLLLLKNPLIAINKNALDKACKEYKDNKFVQAIQKIYPSSLCGTEFAVIFTPAGRCDGKARIQDCSDADKAYLYSAVGSPPMQATYDLMKFLETETKCSGFCSSCVGKLIFSNKDVT